MAKLLIGDIDRYKGVTILSDANLLSDSEFGESLNASLKQWSIEGVRALWFNVKLEHSSWIPHLVKHGFKYHHALPDTAVLLKWLPKTEECPVPPFCHTMIGVGGIVIDDDNNILTVQEKFQSQKYWKLPGGYAEPGEELGEAAIREVFEETGIRTEFRSVLGLRHVHGFNFNSSDMYFIVHLAPLNKETVRCEKEILDVQWMPIKDYMQHPQVHALNRFVAEKFLECKKNGVFFGCTDRLNPINNKPNKLYFIDFGNVDTQNTDTNVSTTTDSSL